jgi:acyl-coenzyme A thioesterase PaaI-like protein
METNPDPDDGPSPTGAQRALVEAIRGLLPAALLATDGSATLARARERVQEAIGLLGARRSSRYEGVPGLRPGMAPENAAIWETHGAFGASNPLAPPVVVTERPGRVEGTLTFSPAYEGGPGTVYGGFIAAVFDGVLGRAVINSGRLGVTRSLTVRYLRPTPLLVPLRIEATIGRVDGRDVEVTGALWVEDRMTCEAEAVFRGVEEARYNVGPTGTGPPPI